MSFEAATRSRRSPQRGDVPTDQSIIHVEFQGSPHTWGCTGRVVDVHSDQQAFPTKMGMVLGVGFADCVTLNVPHNVGMVLSLFSRTCARCNVPHTAWGCPVTGGTTGLAVTVFPTTWGEQKTILQRSRV